MAFLLNRNAKRNNISLKKTGTIRSSNNARNNALKKLRNTHWSGIVKTVAFIAGKKNPAIQKISIRISIEIKLIK